MPQFRRPSLRKLAMSHLMGSAFSKISAPAPTSHPADHGSNEKVHHLHGALPPPGASALTNALKTLVTGDVRVANAGAGAGRGPPYDSPYSRSISSTAPTSPRM